jgi:hypothetical protein
MNIELISVNKINRITHAQSRVELDKATIEDYQQLWQDFIKKIETVGGDKTKVGCYDSLWQDCIESGDYPFPACVVYRPNGIKAETGLNFLADGFHRIQSLSELRVELLPHEKWILCEVRDGSMTDAILHGLCANTSHGLRRNQKDKRRAVLLYYSLNDTHTKESNQHVARACGVSHTFVGDTRTLLVTMLDASLENYAIDLNLEPETVKDIANRLRTANDDGVILATRNGQPLKMIKLAKADRPSSSSSVGKEYLVKKQNEALFKGEVVKVLSESLTDPDLFEIRTEKGEVYWTNQEFLTQIQYPIGTTLRDLDNDRISTVTDYILRGEEIIYASVDDDGFGYKGAAEMYHPVPKEKTGSAPAEPVLYPVEEMSKKLDSVAQSINNYVSPVWLPIAVASLHLLNETDLNQLHQAMTELAVSRLEQDWQREESLQSVDS